MVMRDVDDDTDVDGDEDVTLASAFFSTSRSESIACRWPSVKLETKRAAAESESLARYGGGGREGAS